MTGRSHRAFSIVATLVLAALALSHELIYLLAHGSGEGYVRAMREAGHDRYWTSFVLTVAVVCVALASVGLRQLRRLSRQAASIRAGSASVRDGTAGILGRMTVRLWLLLGTCTSVAFFAQENLETAAVGHPMPGLAAVSGEHAIALPVIAAVSLVVALIGALVRWRREILLARIRTAATVVRPRPVQILRPALDVPTPAWVFAGRQNAVRAPPAGSPRSS